MKPQLPWKSCRTRSMGAHKEAKIVVGVACKRAAALRSHQQRLEKRSCHLELEHSGPVCQLQMEDPRVLFFFFWAYESEAGPCRRTRGKGMQVRVRQARRHRKTLKTPHNLSHLEDGDESNMGSWPQSLHYWNANVNAGGH